MCLVSSHDIISLLLHWCVCTWIDPCTMLSLHLFLFCFSFLFFFSVRAGQSSANAAADKFLGTWQLSGCDTTQCCCITQMDIAQSGSKLFGNAKLTGQLCGGATYRTAAGSIPSNNMVSLDLGGGQTLSATFTDNGTFTGVNSQNAVCNANGQRTAASSGTTTASVMVWKTGGCPSTPSYGTARVNPNTCIDLSLLTAWNGGGK
jgi:hypothetical protein